MAKQIKQKTYDAVKAMRKVRDKNKLTETQILILQLSDADIKNGRLISQEEVDRLDQEWLEAHS